jgi:hypothetical protein
VVWTHSVSSVDSIGSQTVRVNQMHREDDGLAAGQFGWLEMGTVVVSMVGLPVYLRQYTGEVRARDRNFAPE